MADRPTRPEVMATLTEHFGPQVSAALLEAIPPYDWHTIATKSDLASLEHTMDARFAAVDARFAGLEYRFDALERSLDSRFEAFAARFDGRLGAIDGRFDTIDRRFDTIDGRFDTIDRHFAVVDERVDSLRRELTGAFHSEVSRMVRWMVGALAATGAAVAGLVAAIS